MKTMDDGNKSTVMISLEAAPQTEANIMHSVSATAASQGCTTSEQMLHFGSKTIWKAPTHSPARTDQNRFLYTIMCDASKVDIDKTDAYK